MCFYRIAVLSSIKLTVSVRKVLFLVTINTDDYSGKAAGGSTPNRPSRSSDELSKVLSRIDGAQYPAYHDIEGTWQFGSDFQLLIDRAQVHASPQTREREHRVLRTRYA